MAANPVTVNKPEFPRLGPAAFFRDKFQGATGVASNGIATINVPVGLTYYRWDLHLLTSAGAVLTEAQIESETNSLRVLVDGKPFWNIDTAVLYDLQDYYGTEKGAGKRDGILSIDLAECYLHNPAHSRKMAWGTSNVSAISIEIDLGTLTNLATIDFYPKYSEERRELGLHKKLLTFPQSFASTGEHEIPDLPKDPSSAYRALHVTEGSGTIDKVTLKVNQSEWYDNYATLAMQRDVESAGRQPVSGYYHLDFNTGNEALGFLPMVQDGRKVTDLRLKPNFTAAGGAPSSFNVYAEVVEGFQAA